MITTPTVLVLGAGASRPYGFPTADELKDQICEAFAQPTGTASQFLGRHTNHSPDEFFGFKDAFLKSGQSSVDAFLEHRPDFLEVGKLAIAFCLIRFEQEERLYRPDKSRGGNWYGYLSEKLNATFEEFGQNKLSIITFNYDRSLEHYLLNSLHYSHKKEFDECAKTLAKIPIIHVYGQLGQPGYAYPQPLWSKYHSDRDRLINAGPARGITLLHEEVSDLEEAHRLLAAASRICFLGFSYHQLNVKRLKLNRTVKGSKQIFGTRRGLIGGEVYAAEIRIREAIGTKPVLAGEDNLEVLRSHQVLS